MIEAQHGLVIEADIDHVWNYVQDISKWAVLFPGCRDCEVIDEHNSNWTIKVGAGGMIKTVNVLVHVDNWDGPGRVDFSYKLASEPVVGSGSYMASSTKWDYDVAPDGRFIMIKTPDEDRPREISVVLNWFQELEQLVPTD